MDRDDEQLLCRQVYGTDHDRSSLRPDRRYAELIGDPLNVALLDITGWTRDEADTSVALATELRQFGAGGRADSPAHQARDLLGGVSSAPIIVPRLSHSGGRRATVHSHGQDEILGTVCSDHDQAVPEQKAGGTGLSRFRG